MSTTLTDLIEEEKTSKPEPEVDPRGDLKAAEDRVTKARTELDNARAEYSKLQAAAPTQKKIPLVELNRQQREQAAEEDAERQAFRDLLTRAGAGFSDRQRKVRSPIRPLK